MNIAFVFHCPIVPYVGGVQMVTYLLAKTFVNRSHKVVFICTDIRKKDYDYVDYSAPQYYLDISKTQEEYVADYLKILNDNNIQIVISQETRTDSLLLLENTPSAVKKISVVHIKTNKARFAHKAHIFFVGKIFGTRFSKYCKGSLYKEREAFI